MENKAKKLHIIQVIFFLLILCAGSGALICGACEGRTSSELEKRELAEFPAVNANDIFSGRFESDFSEALSDHIVGRDLFVTAKTWAQIALGKKEINGIYIDEDRLIDTYLSSDFYDGQIKINIKALTDFMATCAGEIGPEHVKAVLVPSKCSLYRDDLPEYMPVSKRADTIAGEIRDELAVKLASIPVQAVAEQEDEKDEETEEDDEMTSDDEDSDESVFDDEDSDENIFDDEDSDESINDDEDTDEDISDDKNTEKKSVYIDPKKADQMVIDLRSVLEEHKSEYIYYLTDHHWTTRGAAYAYQTLFPAAGNIVDGKTETVAESFLGTDYNKIHYYKNKDKIMRYVIPEADTARMTINDSGDRSQHDSIYEKKALSTSDKYNYFLSGNYSAIEVDTNAKNDKTLVIIKDSYTNSLLPFLCREYKKIIMIDLRYVNSSVYDYIPEGVKPDDFLIVYNEEKFMQDTHQMYLK